MIVCATERCSRVLLWREGSHAIILKGADLVYGHWGTAELLIHVMDDHLGHLVKKAAKV